MKDNPFFLSNAGIRYRKTLSEVGVIIDAHCHIGKDKSGARMSGDILLNCLDTFSVSKAVIFPFNDPDPGVNFTKANERIYKVYKKNSDRFIPFLRLDPNASDLLKELNMRYRQNFQGIKLHPRAQNFKIDSAAAYKIYRAAEDLSLPVIIHTGFMDDFDISPAIYDISHRFSDLNIILAHSAFVDINSAIEKLKDAENVFFESSMAPIYDIYTILYEIGPDRFIFGSDTPYGDISYSIQAIIEVAISLKIPVNKIRNIFSKNLQKCLK